MAAVALGVSSFALALLLAGAEPEELATALVASLRGSPGIALGDVIGANVTICLVALGVGAWIAPLPFSGSALRYALLGVPLGVIGVWFAWDGNVSRQEGAILVALYVLYVSLIWMIERHPPALGEVGELAEAQQHHLGSNRVGRDLVFVLLGVAAMAGGASLLVEAVRRISHIESTQTKLGSHRHWFCDRLRTGCAGLVRSAAWSIRSCSGRSGRVVRLQHHHDARSCCVGTAPRTQRLASIARPTACDACILGSRYSLRGSAKGSNALSCYSSLLRLWGLRPYRFIPLASVNANRPSTQSSDGHPSEIGFTRRAVLDFRQCPRQPDWAWLMRARLARVNRSLRCPRLCPPSMPSFCRHRTAVADRSEANQDHWAGASGHSPSRG
jgi:Ca2+/Na+ antiporter